MDTLTPEERSQQMRLVRSGNTNPELVVRRLLHDAGFRFRVHRKNLPGKPDIVLPRYKVVVFVHGCFWHAHPGCKNARVPKSNLEYWVGKLNRNVARDDDTARSLTELGWRRIVVWECQISDHQTLIEWLSRSIRNEDKLDTKPV